MMNRNNVDGNVHSEDEDQNRSCRGSIISMCWLKQDATTGIVLLLISAALFSIMGSFVHLAANGDNLPPSQLVCMRAVFQGAFVVLAMFRWKVSVYTTPTDLEESNSSNIEVVRWTQAHGWFGDDADVRKIVVARGMVGSIGFLCFYSAMSMLPLGDAVAVLSLHPIVTVLVAPHVLNDEPFRLAHFIAALCSVIGTACITRPTFLFASDGTMMDDTTKQPSSVGYMFAFTGSCAASAVFLTIRRAGKMKADTLQLLFSWTVFGILMSVLFAVVTSSLSDWHWPTNSQSWLYVLGLCVFGSVAHFLMNYAGRMAPAGLASIIRSTDIVYSYILQIVVFHTIPSPVTFIGVSLVIFSLVLLAISKIKLKRQQKRLGNNEEQRYLLENDPLNDTIYSIPILDESMSTFGMPRTKYLSASSLTPLS